jgi:cytochrome c-type protein NapB
MKTRALVTLVAAIVAGAMAIWMTAALAQNIGGTRGPTPLDQNAAQPPIPAEVNDDVRRGRAYPEQPPVIPHTIQNYEISLNANKCLTCHGRQFTQQSQAPMISVTHFMGRDDQVLATVSARRFFCTQCHVPQHDAKPLVENNFRDIDSLILTQTGVDPKQAVRRKP